MPFRHFRTLLLVASLLALTACRSRAPADGPLVVFNAGSLARPLRAALDTFARRERVRVEQESAGSLESARKLTELGKIPDLIALADADVFPGYLVPTHVDAYVRFARNRMVLAYTPRSLHADSITSANWWEVLQRPGVEVGRADPDRDPNGYRTLMVWQLAERATGIAGLAARLAAAAPPRNVRPKEADLIGLLEAGEFDYIWSYESIARSLGLRWVTLGDSMDLAEPSLAAFYGEASVAVRGASAGGSVTFRGQPIVYALAVPRNAPHPALAARFAAFLLGDEGRAILRREGLDALDEPMAAGVAPAWLPRRAPARTTP
jgi:molybdate/tungstate transport system substrate-binding protein